MDHFSEKESDVDVLGFFSLSDKTKKEKEKKDR